MRIGLGTFAKLARGGLCPDELGELMAAMGIEAVFSPVSLADALPVFQVTAEAASLPSSRIVRIEARMKGGGSMIGVLVLNQKSNEE